jgi:hypothetical protein
MTRRRAGATVLLVGLASIAVAAHGRSAPDEFSGDGWYQGRVLVCRHGSNCAQLRYPLPGHATVYVEFTTASTGKRYGSLAVDNDGTFGWWAAPDTYTATLKPGMLYGLRAGTVRVRTTANGRVAFDLSYGPPRR